MTLSAVFATEIKGIIDNFPLYALKTSLGYFLLIIFHLILRNALLHTFFGY